MAIAKVKKVQIVAHKSQERPLLEALQDTGMLVVSGIEELTAKDKSWDMFLPVNIAKDASLDDTINKLSFTIHYIASFSEARSAMVGKKYTVKRNEFDNINNTFDYGFIYKKCVEAENALKDIAVRISQASALAAELSDWQALKSPLSDIGPTRNTQSSLGIVDIKLFDSIKAQLDKNGFLYDIEIIKKDTAKKRILLLFVCHNKDVDAISDILKKTDFKRVYFPHLTGAPSEEINNLKTRLGELHERREIVIKEIRKLMKEHRKLSILHDCLYNLRSRLNARFLLGNTNSTVLINGWVKNSDLKAFNRTMSDFKEAEVLLSDPLKGDVVPVDLENPAIVRPFEFVTRIYGLPRYGELDATPMLAPFFFIFLGFCIADAGYGVVLVLFSVFMLMKFKRMSSNAKRFVQLLALGGISTIIFGSMLGGWFGNLIDIFAEHNKFFAPLQKAKQHLVLLDTNKDPLTLLLISLGLGIVQLWWGHVSAIAGNIKNRRYLDAFMDQGSVLLFLAGVTGIVFTMAGLLKEYAKIFCPMAIIGAVFIVLTQGRAEKGIGGKIFNGCFALYSTASGYISDILSYCRLWALGMVGGVMAMTCNLIGFMLGAMIPVVGFLVTAMILICGHLFTVAISVLGALVHSGRLQFVEFFPKFYKSGGRPFMPLRIENKYTVIE